MSMYYKGKLISGVREVPQMTLAEYNALTNKPKLWLRTDAPESDRGISASDVEYSTGVSVEDKIDSMYQIKKVTKTLTSDNSGSLDFADFGTNVVILQVKVIDSASQRLQAGVYLGTYASYWFGILRRYTDMTVLANTQVNVEIYYV